MHSLCGHGLLLSRPLLPQAGSLHPVPADRRKARLLQSQTVALYFLLADVVVSGHLLPQTIPTVLLASQPRVLPLSSIRLRGSRPRRYSHEALIAKKLTRRLIRRRAGFRLFRMRRTRLLRLAVKVNQNTSDSPA